MLIGKQSLIAPNIGVSGCNSPSNNERSHWVFLPLDSRECDQQRKHFWVHQLVNGRLNGLSQVLISFISCNWCILSGNILYHTIPNFFGGRGRWVSTIYAPSYGTSMFSRLVLSGSHARDGLDQIMVGHNWVRWSLSITWYYIEVLNYRLLRSIILYFIVCFTFFHFLPLALVFPVHCYRMLNSSVM